MITVYDANVVSLEQLDKIEPVNEKAGRFWKGIKHSDLVDVVADEVERRGWKIEDEKFSLSEDRHDFAGAFGLTIPDLDSPDGQKFSIGFMSSNNFKRSVKISCGTEVSVCNNGMITGELILARKHTLHLNLREEIEPAIDRYWEKVREIPTIVNGLQERDLSITESDSILMEAGRRNLASWGRIGLVDKEFHDPRYPEHGTGTSWTMLMAFTEIVKRYDASQQMERANEFRELLPLAVSV